jgi:purine-binding chemotaxis protein CheW
MEEERSAYVQETQEMVDLAGKYLTFELGQEEYGIGILKIREIIGMMPITAVPQTPSFIKGVINLRGKVIPVTDLRMKFGLETTGYNERTCIIVVEIDCGSRELIMGLMQSPRWPTLKGERLKVLLISGAATKPALSKEWPK